MNDKVNLIKMLLGRLERISVDSHWAHRASGIRGALIRSAERMEAGQTVEDGEIQRQVDAGFSLLEISAREKRPPRWRQKRNQKSVP
ncbi:MAG: hypothetical protein LDL50_02490 [Chloroflexi bacterium]|nr:hypothetical protein [Chloroflexota bacterium]